MLIVRDKNKEGIKISEALYYIFLILMFGLKGLGLYDGQIVYKLFFLAAMACAAGKIFLTSYTKKEWFWVILLGLLAVIIERNSGEKGVLICYAILAGMKEIPLKKIFRLGAVIYACLLCLMVSYYGIFLEQSSFITEIRVGLGDTVRYGLGYSHPNTLMVTYLATITLIILCLREKYNWKHALILATGMLYLYWYCMSYTALITCTMVIVLPFYLFKLRKGGLGIAEYAVGAVALPLSLAYSFLAPYYMPAAMLQFFQNHLSTFYSRLKLAKMYVIPSNISLLGTHVTKVTDSKYTLDNSFLYAFIFNGVLFFAVIMVLYFYMMYRLIKDKRNLELIITCVFFVQAIMEPYMFNTSFKNITLFFLGELIWDHAKLAEGRFDSYKITIPRWVTDSIRNMSECWKQQKRSILVISGAVGGAVFFIGMVFYRLSGSTEVSAFMLCRESIALALPVMWMAMVILFGIKMKDCKK